MTTTDYVSMYPTLAAMVKENRHHTLHALIFTDRIIAGGRDSYEEITHGQPSSDQLSLENFIRLNNFYYLFRVCPAMRQVLETYLILDGYSKTLAAKNQLFYLSKGDNAQHNKEISNLLRIAGYGNLPEISRLNRDDHKLLLDVIGFRAYLDRVSQDAYTEPDYFGEDAQRVLLAASISLFAAKDVREIGYPNLTDSAVSDLLTLIIKRYKPVMAAEIYALGKSAD